MGATIHYRSTSKVDPYLKQVGAPASFMEAMERAFGHFPVELDEHSLDILRGMPAADKGMSSAYEEVMQKIEQHGSIQLYASW